MEINKNGMKARFSEPIRDLMLAVVHNTSISSILAGHQAVTVLLELFSVEH